jgi:hypothetical protein
MTFAQEHQYASGDNQIMLALRQAVAQLFPEAE